LRDLYDDVKAMINLEGRIKNGYKRNWTCKWL
jgi:hypothetical protein